jgi:lysophospholipase L1-like esterase
VQIVHPVAALRPALLGALALLLVLTGCGPAGSAAPAPSSSVTSSTPSSPRSAASSVPTRNTTTRTTSSTTPSAPAATPARPPVVVGLGDSVTSGYGCDCETFVQRYAAQLPPAKGGPARPINLGKGGSTSVDLLHDLRSDAATRRDVASADVVLVTIGANDLGPLLPRWLGSDCDNTCYDGAVAAVGRRVGAIVRQIHALRGSAPQQVLVTGYWNVFVDGEVGRQEHGTAYLRWSDRLTRALNAQIAQVATAAGATCVHLYAPFKSPTGDRDPTPLLAPDGDHPDAAGHEVIAKALLAATSPIESHS